MCVYIYIHTQTHIGVNEQRRERGKQRLQRHNSVTNSNSTGKLQNKQIITQLLPARLVLIPGHGFCVRTPPVALLAAHAFSCVLAHSSPASSTPSSSHLFCSFCFHPLAPIVVASATCSAGFSTASRCNNNRNTNTSIKNTSIKNKTTRKIISRMITIIM